MSETASIAIFTRAALMLAEADTIQKAKELKSLSLTAADWARRKGMGEEAILHCRSYALEAERKMGSMLSATDLQKPGDHWKKKRLPDVTVTPSLEEIGLTKRESVEAQALADLPQETFEAIKSGEKTRVEVKKELRTVEIAEQRAAVAATASGVKPSDRWRVVHSDMDEWTADCRFDFVVTDPPYGKEFLPLYETLASRSRDWLKDGGMLVAMCGQSYLDEIYALMSKHLSYYWTAAYLTPGQPTPLRMVNVNTNWKPLLMFTKGDYTGKIFGDVFRSDANDKSFHRWGQSESGMADIVSRLTIPGQSILDPFCGAGTTGVAALRCGCLFTGVELEKENADIATARLGDETK